MMLIVERDVAEIGRRRVADLVVAAMGWKSISGPQVERTGRVSRATVDRVKRYEVVSEAMLRALGDVLGLPRDFLLYVRDGDQTAIAEAGSVDPDLVRWTLRLFAEDDDLPPPGSEEEIETVMAGRA